MRYPSTLSFSAENYSLTTSLWEALLGEHGLYYRTGGNWQSKLPSFDEPVLGHCLHQYEGRGAQPYSEAIFVDPVVKRAFHITFSRGTLTVTAASATMTGAREAYAIVEHLYEKVEPPEKGLSVGFWAANGRQPTCFFRQLSAPTWDSIRDNYTQSAKEPLDKLMQARFNSESSGKLVLWQGFPGTGKTFALRALGQSWKSWAKMHYILDPEQFFGADANYMIQVITGDEDDPSGVPAGFDNDDDDDDDEIGPLSQDWRLVILEDTGELLTRDAKQNTGQALSRLLNVCDGLVGQGLRVVVLITTNEDISQMHEAVMRPGRLASKVIFKPFTSGEAETWLTNHNAADWERLTGTHTLADLYARLSGEYVPPQRKEAGFAGFR